MTPNEKDRKELIFSNPKNGEQPNLVPFNDLNGPNPTIKLPPVKDEYGTSARFRLLELPRSEAGEVFLHVYNTTGVGLRVRVYGVSRGAEIEALPGYQELTGALARLPLKLADGFDHYLVRFGIGIGDEEAEKTFGELDKFQVAAYDGREPQSPGGIEIEPTGKEQGIGRYLPFSHNGRSFQRLVISSCDPADDVRALLKASGLEEAETYYGKLGSVVAVGVPPGMSLNTGVDTTQTIRQKANGGGGTVSEDYLVNLFEPKEPTDKSSGDPWAKRREESARSTINLPEFNPPHPQQFDCDRDPLTVAIIDSGIDYSSPNNRHWKATRYERGADTEYVTPGAYGYDFIRRREEPIDEAPHGTYVAATVLNQYRSERPLQLLHMKVFGAEGIASYFGSLVSIYEAAAAGAKVINMSWGFYQPDPPRALYCALKTAARHGVLMVTSAGNDTRDLDEIPQWPAAFADDFPCNLITVASYLYKDPARPGAASVALTDISNYGKWEVPVAAFLTSPVPKFQDGATTYPVGTSISAPIVAGLLASWLADNPQGTIAEFRKKYYQPAQSLEARITNGQYIAHDSSPWTV